MLLLVVMELFLLQQVQKNVPHVQVELGLVQAPLQVANLVEIIAQAVIHQDVLHVIADIKYQMVNAL